MKSPPSAGFFIAHDWRNVHWFPPYPCIIFIAAGDVLVLYGTEHDCAAAEMKIMQG